MQHHCIIAIGGIAKVVAFSKRNDSKYKTTMTANIHINSMDAEAAPRRENALNKTEMPEKNKSYLYKLLRSH